MGFLLTADYTVTVTLVLYFKTDFFSFSDINIAQTKVSA